MTRAILVAVVLCCFVVKAQADDYNVMSYYNGNELYKNCQSSSPFCMGFVAGVIGYTSFEGQLCLARGVTIGQVEDVVKLWLRDHPEKRHLGGGFLVVQALKEKFPCN